MQRTLPWELSLVERRTGGFRDAEAAPRAAEPVVHDEEDPHLEDTRRRLLKAKALVYGRMYVKAHNIVESLGPSASLSYAQSGEPELYSPELLAARDALTHSERVASLIGGLWSMCKQPLPQSTLRLLRVFLSERTAICTSATAPELAIDALMGLWEDGVVTRHVYALTHQRFLIALAPLGAGAEPRKAEAITAADWAADVGLAAVERPVLPTAGMGLSEVDHGLAGLAQRLVAAASSAGRESSARDAGLSALHDETGASLWKGFVHWLVETRNSGICNRSLKDSRRVFKHLRAAAEQSKVGSPTAVSAGKQLTSIDAAHARGGIGDDEHRDGGTKSPAHRRRSNSAFAVNEAACEEEDDEEDDDDTEDENEEEEDDDEEAAAREARLLIMNQRMFFASVFSITDAWTATTSEEEYSRFLSFLTDALTPVEAWKPPPSDIDPSVEELGALCTAVERFRAELLADTLLNAADDIMGSIERERRRRQRMGGGGGGDAPTSESASSTNLFKATPYRPPAFAADGGDDAAAPEEPLPPAASPVALKTVTVGSGLLAAEASPAAKRPPGPGGAAVAFGRWRVAPVQMGQGTRVSCSPSPPPRPAGGAGIPLGGGSGGLASRRRLSDTASGGGGSASPGVPFRPLGPRPPGSGPAPHDPLAPTLALPFLLNRTFSSITRSLGALPWQASRRRPSLPQPSTGAASGRSAEGGAVADYDDEEEEGTGSASRKRGGAVGEPTAATAAPPRAAGWAPQGVGAFASPSPMSEASSPFRRPGAPPADRQRRASCPASASAIADARVAAAASLLTLDPPACAGPPSARAAALQAAASLGKPRLIARALPPIAGGQAASASPVPPA